ncbi:unnamed protein product [Lactuca virosa]|uniref:G-patch domain-containing protein n=1 Tax=Lactuca virosa TaxID=75947 RepID=A0AAU9NG47_9ASTR|nr:unnamed protein product [Lactuca virosa]
MNPQKGENQSKHNRRHDNNGRSSINTVVGGMRSVDSGVCKINVFVVFLGCDGEIGVDFGDNVLKNRRYKVRFLFPQFHRHSRSYQIKKSNFTAGGRVLRRSTERSQNSANWWRLYRRTYSGMSNSEGSSTATPISSSNIGFQLLKKHGWKEGTGLGISEQGRLEPVQAFLKKNKRGLGAAEIKKPQNTGDQKNLASDKTNDKLSKKSKAKLSKKMKKAQEIEKRKRDERKVIVAIKNTIKDQRSKINIITFCCVIQMVH